MSKKIHLRRNTLVAAAALTLLASTAIGAPATAAPNPNAPGQSNKDQNQPTTTIELVGINDFHGRIEANGAEAGAAVLAGAVKEYKAKNRNTLFVSAGDNIGASTFTSFSQQDNPTIDALKAAGLDASAVGNHEFDGGFDDLLNRVIPRYGNGNAEAGADYALGANVYAKGTKTPALKEYTLKKLNGVTVGLIGTVTDQTASLVTPAGISGLDFGDQLEAANRVAAQLSDGKKSNGEADVIVLLTHEGSSTSDCAAIGAEDTSYGDLIRGATGQIDAIISGHTHVGYSCAYPVDGWAEGLERPVMQAHQYGTTLDTLKISVAKKHKKVVGLEAGLVSLTTIASDGSTVPRFTPVPKVATIVEAALAQAEVVGAVEIGAISADITRGGTNGSDRGVESTLGNLVADMHLWATSNEDFGGTPTQIAFMNPGGLRADLLFGTDGTVTYKDAASVQPFGNTLFTMDLTGAQIKAILEEQWQPEGSSRSKLHLGISEGFTYTYDPDAARGAHITSMSYQGEPIAEETVFRIVTNSFLAAGGDNFFTFAQGTNVADSGQIDLVAGIEYFQSHTLVDPAPLGRAQIDQ
ncbi:bifunctional metallophosphatase/5'-nucleotidase [Paeniglutamicibacter gangotriensis]|uniref:Bifunctional metallophosphatase/5'-nucleotidase n=1 Tax=Paeniglutamicibacter gangotriensis TaxID=254787 RepID=A0A5B0EBE5_9MICC|nr:bifunctional UDP-sugar hydrolase/5'-nucleotidase [Paeniglutamicibacter gangotriensis]KAA0976028.1 bifunctional metallophosphatase/5'-nucleotidase [Paeniglutamicibacter gangotriensis]